MKEIKELLKNADRQLVIDPENPLADEIKKVCEATLVTAREIQHLLTELNIGYDTALDALKKLEAKLDAKIEKFFEDVAPLEEQLRVVKQEMDEIMREIEEIKPKIEEIKQVADQAKQSLVRLEEINTNVTQIEQRIKDLLAMIDIDNLEKRAQEILAKFDSDVGAVVSKAISDVNEKLGELEEAVNTLERTKTEAIQAVNQAKEDASREIGQVKDQATSEINSIKDSAIQATNEAKDAAIQEMSQKKDEMVGLVEEKGDEKIAEIQSILTGGGRWIKTFKTITRASCIYGYAWQEVQVDGNGSIIKYGDLFVRGDRMSGTAGSGEKTGYFRIPFPSNIEMDLFGFFYNFFIARPKAGQGEDNCIYVYGANESGQLGTGNTNRVKFPKKIILESRVKDIGFLGFYGGNKASVLLLENGNVWVSGKNSEYCLGLGNNVQVNQWTKSNISNVTKINTDSYLTLFAAKTDNSVWIVGQNNYGFGGCGDTFVHTNWVLAKTFDNPVEQIYAAQYYLTDAYRALSMVVSAGEAFFAGWNVEKQLNTSGGNITRHTKWANGNFGGQDRFYSNGVGILMIGHDTLEENDYLWASGYLYDLSDGAGSSDNATPHQGKLLYGSGWKFCQYNQHLDGFRQNSAYLYNEEKRRILVVGYSHDNTAVGDSQWFYKTADDLYLPRDAATCKNFEVRRFFVGQGNAQVLCVICDDKLYATGEAAMGLVAATNNFVQLQ